MAVTDVSVRTVNFKIITLYLLLFIDLIISTFVEFTFDQTLSKDVDQTILFIIFATQLAFQVVLLIWFFFLFWSTFLLRYGLIGILVSNFKYTIMYIPFNLLFNIADRVIRLIITLDQDKGSYKSVWDNGLYRAAYYVRYINLVVYYVVMLNVASRIALPQYYKPSKWLK